jgi:hypothetical protein
MSLLREANANFGGFTNEVNANVALFGKTTTESFGLGVLVVPANQPGGSTVTIDADTTCVVTLSNEDYNIEFDAAEFYEGRIIQGINKGEGAVTFVEAVPNTITFLDNAGSVINTSMGRGANATFICTQANGETATLQTLQGTYGGSPVLEVAPSDVAATIGLTTTSILSTSAGAATVTMVPLYLSDDGLPGRLMDFSQAGGTTGSLSFVAAPDTTVTFLRLSTGLPFSPVVTAGTTLSFVVISVTPTSAVLQQIRENFSIFPPSAPLNAAASVGPGGGAATVSWTVPASDGGSPIVSYTVTSAPGGVQVTTAGTSTVVSGLTPGTPYTFTVFATNAAGNSPNSTASNAVVPAGVPTAPLNVIASTGPNSGTANISWTTPVSDGGSAILSYTVTSSPGGIQVTTTATTTLISGLTDGVTYTFTVYATNAVGNSPTSAASNSITPTSLPTPSVWFDPSEASKVTLSSGRVTGLTDLTPNGYDGTYINPFVAASYVAPVYNVTPINGLATFRIDNSAATVQTICVPEYNFNDTFISYALVVRYISGTSGIIATDTPGLFGRGFGCDVAPAVGTLQTISYNAFITWDGTPSPNITLPVGTPAILIASISAGNWIFSLNGTQYTLALTQAKAPDNSNGLNIGCWNPSNAASIIFDCGEVLAYTSFLTPAQIVSVEGYLATKWGLTSSLPPSHPYYSP